MQAVPVSATSIAGRIRPRTVLVASADSDFRRRLARVLTGLRWQVREAAGGAEAWSQAENITPEAMIVDSWLPDLELGEFLKEFRGTFPQVDLIAASGTAEHGSPRGPHRQELLYAVHSAQETDTAAWNAAGPAEALAPPNSLAGPRPPRMRSGAAVTAARPDVDRLPELVGNAPCMVEISRRVRLVAPRSTPVLIEGPTGSGKEIVAEALHRLSPRSVIPRIKLE